MIGGYSKVYLYKRIVQAKLFIDEHYAEPMDVNNVAGEAHYSRFHFLRLFKKIYGTTPHQYLIRVRIDHAIKLLGSGALVSDTCDAVGFESVSSFSGLFKRLVGSTPSSYLLTQQRMRQQMSETPLQFVPGCFAEKRDCLKSWNPSPERSRRMSGVES